MEIQKTDLGEYRIYRNKNRLDKDGKPIIVGRILLKPSKKYLDIKAEKKQERYECSMKQIKQNKARILIEEKIRENAKQQLIDEGILDKEGLPK